MRLCRQVAVLGLLLQGVLAPMAWGRYLEGDDELIDQEDAMNREYYNDELSYRYSRPWIKRWDQSLVGVRADAGSLNANRFHYQHDIKAMTDPVADLFLAYTQTWRDDVVEERHLQEVLFGARLVGDLRAGITGHAGTWKKVGDLGLLVGWWGEHWRDFKITFQAVSTDHYFNTKEEDMRDRYEPKPYTYATQFVLPVFGTKLKGRYEFDTPTLLRKGSDGYTYQNFQRELELGAETHLDEWTLRIDAYRQQKEETKTWNITSAAWTEKQLVRTVTRAEAAVDYELTPTEIWTAGLFAVERVGQYDYAIVGVLPETVGEAWTPDTTKSEQALYATRHAPLLGLSWLHAQNGLYFNKVRINEAGTIYPHWEVKYGFNAEFVINERSMFAIVTTWDLDQVWMDFPFDPYFRPWGGGGFQVQMTF